jgi:hypothetical protein
MNSLVCFKVSKFSIFLMVDNPILTFDVLVDELTQVKLWRIDHHPVEILEEI